MVDTLMKMIDFLETEQSLNNLTEHIKNLSVLGSITLEEGSTLIFYIENKIEKI